ncbi:MAG: putative porin [Bacteroidales bacterium]|jgi:hypothetical protein|nr:putative porin [Bacteroidales bacterium]
MKKNILHILIALFAFHYAAAQVPAMVNPMQNTGFHEDTTLVYKTDTVKRKKEIRRYYYNSFFTARRMSAIDTMHLRFFEYEPNAQLSSYSTNLGQFASPAFNLRAVPINNSIPFWLPAVQSLFYDSEDMPVYNTTVPFTVLTYSGGMHKEQQVKALHTQNVNKDLNVGLYLQYYKVVGEESQRHQSSGSNIAPWIAYNGNRFSTYFRFNFNNINRQESGGVVQDSLINTIALTPRMTNAQSTISYNTMLFVQKWNLLPQPIIDSTSIEMPHYPLAVGVSLNYKKSNFLYSDMNVKAANYANLFHDSLRMLDTAMFRIITPTAFVEGELRHHKQSLHALLAFGYEYQYNYYRDYDLQFPQVNSNHYLNILSLRYTNKLFFIDHTQQYDYNGDYSTDNLFHALMPLTKNYTLKFKASYNYLFQVPHQFYSQYAANTARWTNDLKSERSHHAGGEISTDFGNISLKADYYNLNNYMYITADAVAVQAPDVAQSTILEAKKNTDLRWLSLQNGIIYQQSTIRGTQNPTWATYNSVALRFRFYRKLIDCLLGAEALYYPTYSAPQFIPSLGVYAPQSERELGDFPIVNAFLTVKYKPIRVMIKYNNAGVHPNVLERHFLALHYPQPSGYVVFSASWMFYN